MQSCCHQMYVLLSEQTHFLNHLGSASLKAISICPLIKTFAGKPNCIHLPSTSRANTFLSHQHFYFKRMNIKSILQMKIHSSFINIHQSKYISCVKFRICIIITFSSAILYQVLPSQPVFLLHPKTVNIKF